MPITRTWSIATNIGGTGRRRQAVSASGSPDVTQSDLETAIEDFATEAFVTAAVAQHVVDEH
jgi:hypothetical protein